MKPLWRRPKRLIPVCPKCKEELIGQNTDEYPWKCKCGIWKWVKSLESWIIINNK